MNDHKIRYLKEIVKVKSINKAAKSLFLSPAALSTALKSLEKELGFTLLIRTKAGVIPSQAAYKLLDIYDHYETALSHLTQEEQSKEKLFSEMSGTIDLVTSYGAIDTVLYPPLNELFCRNFQNLTFNIEEHSIAKIENMVLDDEIHFGLIFMTENESGENYLYRKNDDLHYLHQDLRFHKLLTQRYAIVVHQNSPFASFNSVSFESIWKYPCVSYYTVTKNNYEYETIPFLDDSYSFFPSNSFITTNSYRLYQMMIATGQRIGITLVSDNEKFVRDGFVHIPIKDNIQVHYGYICKAIDHFEPNDKWIVTYLERALL